MESVALDLDSAAGRERLADLGRGADALIGSAPPAELARRGVDLDAIEARHPALVYAAATAFGWDGPHAGRHSSEIAGYAVGGSMYFCGDEQREPLMVHSHQSQLHAGMQRAYRTQAAINEKHDK